MEHKNSREPPARYRSLRAADNLALLIRSGIVAVLSVVPVFRDQFDVPPALVSSACISLLLAMLVSQERREKLARQHGRQIKTELARMNGQLQAIKRNIKILLDKEKSSILQ